MNNYIIDPNVFYWINTFGMLQTIFAVFGGLLTATSVIAAITWLFQWHDLKIYNNKTPEVIIPTCKKITLIAGIIGGIFVLVSIFIPGKTTSIEMLIAKTATFDNVDWTVQQVKEVVDYIVAAIQGVV